MTDEHVYFRQFETLLRYEFPRNSAQQQAILRRLDRVVVGGAGLACEIELLRHINDGRRSEGCDNG